jgi:nucleoside-diphosphate-sugar epimerase
MRVVITGAAGFLGLALTRAFARAGHAVLAADALPPTEFHPRVDTPLGHVQYVTADVTDRAALPDLLGSNIDAVVHAAALTPTALQERDDPERIVEVNLGGTVNMLAFARTTPACRKFLYVSSAGVFDQGKAAILGEEDATGGNSLYGAAKFACEGLVLQYGRLFGLDVAVVRPTSLYGPGEQPRPSRPNTTALYQLIEAAQRNEPVQVTGCEARGDWLYVDDAADAICRLVASDHLDGQVFNLSSGKPCTFGEVIAAVTALLPLRIDDHATPVIDGGSDRPAIIANQRIRQVLGWEPGDLAMGLRHYIESLRQGMGTHAPHTV